MSTETEIDLHSALAEATENKPAGTSTGPAWDFENESTETFATDPQTENPNAAASTSEFLNDDKRSPEEKLRKPRVPDEVKRASAETATAALDSLLGMVCVPLIDRKIRKRLTEEEMDKGFSLEDRKDDELDDEDLRIKKKFVRLMKLRDHKQNQIPLSNKEEKNIETAFYNYFKIKDIAMPPEWLLYISLSTVIIDRVIEVATD